MRPSIIAMLLATPLLAAGCRERNLDEVRMSEQQVIDAGEIAGRPSSYYGRPVTVVAKVEAVYGPNTFTLDDKAGLDGPDVLVIVPKVAKPVEKAHEVTVHGIVRPFDATALNRDYAWFDVDTLDPVLVQRFQQRPVIIADSIRDREGGDLIVGAVRRPTAVN
jgi:hypothetical protein